MQAYANSRQIEILLMIHEQAGTERFILREVVPNLNDVHRLARQMRALRERKLVRRVDYENRSHLTGVWQLTEAAIRLIKRELENRGKP